MDAGTWWPNIGHATRLVIAGVPEACWLIYSWAKDWQGLLAGFFLLAAAWVFAKGSERAARIRADAMIRAAELGAGAQAVAGLRTVAAQPQAVRVEALRPLPGSPENELLQRVEQLRSLIRSAMSTLTSDAGRVSSAPNFYCERITLLRFDETSLPPGLTPAQRELHKKLVLTLAALRQATEKKVPQAELSQALVQLNARARELSNALSTGGKTVAGALRK